MAKRRSKVGLLHPVLRGPVEEVRAMELARERALKADVGAIFAGLFTAFQEDLGTRFRRSSIRPSKRPEAEPPPEPVWDPLAAADLAPELELSFDDLVAAAELEALGILEEELVETYEEGYLTELWLLAQLGVDVELPPEADPGEINGLILAAAIGGATYFDRLRHWGTVYSGKVGQTLRASIVSGATQDETEQRLQLILTQYEGRIDALLGSEVQRAFTLGAEAALTAYREEVDAEMWVTRQDPLVCPMCEALDGEITPLQPVDDTHPTCRCRKVPVVFNTEGRPVSYTAFRAELEG